MKSRGRYGQDISKEDVITAVKKLKVASMIKKILQMVTSFTIILRF